MRRRLTAHRFAHLVAIVALSCFFATLNGAQSQTNVGSGPLLPRDQQTPANTSAPSLDRYETVPVLSGGAAFVPTVDNGHFKLVTVFAPVLLLPIGDHWLLESRVTFEGDFTNNEFGHFGGKVKQGIDYAQLDYIANPYLTVSAGRFLTAFGLYNERMYPVWIRNMQTEPLILPLEEDSSNGVMLRGGIKATPNLDVLYAASFSALSTIDHLESDRQTGGRFGFFFPDQRVEVGFSAKHFLQAYGENRYGFHFEWQPRAQPLDVRAEYANGAQGHGYWIEPAFRLSQFSSPSLNRMQLVARVQQYFVKQAGSNDALPDADTQQIETGVNYYFSDGLRATASFGRHFASSGDGNVWTVGLTYRFAFPLGAAR